MDANEYAYLTAIKAGCKICHGVGYQEVRSIVNKTAQITLTDCSCVQHIQREIKFIEANIPRKYRKWTFSQLTPEFLGSNKKSFNKVKKYIENIYESIRSGVGLWFFSMPGIAKSSIICNILKKSIDRNYTAYYTHAAHLIDLKFRAMRNDEQAKQTIQYILNKVQIMAIEEIEKRTLPGSNEFGQALFYEFISEIYDANISLLISSNILREECEKPFPHFIRDRFKNLTNIPLIGASGRTDHRSDHRA